jgi:hypothetical protein
MLIVNDAEGIPAGRSKPYDFYDTFVISRPEDEPLRGSKHVACLKYTNRNGIFNIVFDGNSSTYLILYSHNGMAAHQFNP